MGKSKNPKRVAAGKKAAETRKRNIENKYSKILKRAVVVAASGGSFHLSRNIQNEDKEKTVQIEKENLENLESLEMLENLENSNNLKDFEIKDLDNLVIKNLDTGEDLIESKENNESKENIYAESTLEDSIKI